MYEESSKKIKINWRSVLIKILILLIVVFLIIWIISLFKKDEKKVSNLNTNLNIMKEAAEEYFNASNLPTELNGKVKLTLEDMLNKKLVIEFKDQNGKSCNLKDSYAEVTKLNDEDYSMKVKLVCQKESDYVIDTIKVPVPDKTDDKVEDNKQDNNQENNTPNEEQKPATGTTTNNNQKPSTESTTNNNQKPSSGNTTNNNNNNQKPSSTPTTKPSTENSKPTTETKPTCEFGSKDYFALYPLAYTIDGSCAVSKDDYFKASYANKVSDIAAVEYKKLSDEISALAKETGKSLYVEAPKITGVYNKTNTGLVGYQILMVAKMKNTYSTDTIYEYYLDEYSNRSVIFDVRSSLKSSVVAVQSITLDKTTLELGPNATYNLIATIKPNNATNKNITWTSSNPEVATITNGLVTAKNVGYTVITASINDLSATCLVYVKNNIIPVTSIKINNDDETMKVGNTKVLSATINPSNSTNKNITWSSSNSSVVSVSSEGVIYAKKAGTAKITASIDNVSDSIIITVNDRNVYTKTYYIMGYTLEDEALEESIHGYVFKDIPIYAQIENINFDYYTTYDEYNTYKNTDWTNKIAFYDGYDFSNKIDTTARSYSRGSLTKENFTITKESTFKTNNYHGVYFITKVNNVNNATVTFNGYFIPIKITVTYSID